MIYTDGVHIIGETLEELHAFAVLVGIKRCWFHKHRSHSHYDKPKRFPLDKLLSNGACLVDSKTIVRIINKNCGDKPIGR